MSRSWPGDRRTGPTVSGRRAGHAVRCTLMATNFTGHPGLSLRAGFVESPTRGIGPTAINPSGPKHRITQNVAFHGRLFEEGKMLAVARALEARLGVAGERPPIG